MRTLLLLTCAVVFLPKVARASFEMALIYDATNRQIVRYDPVNHVSLGSFGQGLMGYFANQPSLSTDPFVAESVNVLDIQGYLRRINFHTGIEIDNVQLATGGTIFNEKLKTLATGNYMVSSSSGVTPKIFHRTTGAVLLNMATYSGYTTVDAEENGDGTYTTLERFFNGSNYDYYLFHRDGSGYYDGGFTSIQSGNSISAFLNLNRKGNRFYASGHTGVMNMADYDRSGVSYSSVNLGYSAFFGSSETNVIFGHSSSAYFFQNMASGPAYLYRLDTVANYYQPITLTPYTQELGSVVIVNAPEPASFAVLGLGLIPLLRRRKRA